MDFLYMYIHFAKNLHKITLVSLFSAMINWHRALLLFIIMFMKCYNVYKGASGTVRHTPLLS